MTQSLFAALLICSMSGPGWPQGARPNFTGTWNLDMAKSDFGGSPPPEALTHTIDHNEPNVRIATTTKSEIGESTGEQVVTTDGKEHINKMQAMGMQQEVKVTGKWDGEKLATSWSITGQGGTIYFSDSWSLSADGRILTLVRVAKTPQGDFVVKLVHNKQ